MPVPRRTPGFTLLMHAGELCSMRICKWAGSPPILHDRRLAYVCLNRLPHCLRPAGRANVSFSDRASAWFPRLDRLETPRHRGQPSHHRHCDLDARPHAEGRRHQRRPAGVARHVADARSGLPRCACACAFFTLTFYDLFALRTIGRKHVPYRIAALSSFTSYTVGHNVGATVFTGGAIRFRIYSEWGLTAIDVAKICFVSGLTFWLGNLFVLGIGMIWHPEAATPMNLLPPEVNRLIGIGCVAGIVAYLVWLSLGAGPARARPERLEGGAAVGAADAAADRHRRRRSRLLRAGDVHSDAVAARTSTSCRWRWSSSCPPCSASPAMRPAASACSTRRCWWRCRSSARNTCSRRCWCFACSISSSRS